MRRTFDKLRLVDVGLAIGVSLLADALKRS
jgi:hypothetical protein